jgi:predicted enzyme related to lactoylglutathione lyase
MITHLSHATAYVLDQDRAKAFYTDKLGFEVRNDVAMDGFRWLTVGPKGQPDLELILMPITPSPMMDEATCATIRALVERGALGAGVLATADCHQTCHELQARGVELLQPPQERPYGIEALIKDDSGNWFSLTQAR